jgi:DOPA 4,5-dioxygenase
MTDLPDGSVPRSNSEIASFHAHVYYDPNATRPEAERLRSWIGERFAVTLGRWHDVKVGPHDQAMFQVAFAVEVFPALVPWLMLNHGRLNLCIGTTNPRRIIADRSDGPALAVHADRRRRRPPEQALRRIRTAAASVTPLARDAVDCFQHSTRRN